MPQGELWLSPTNPWLLAALVLVALVRRDLLTTIVGGMAAFMLLRFGFGF
ncbi:AzlD domain-containing protein [Marinobacterium sp. CAU 1594]|nr:AzlD domain-containing protein [Marinobacterium arenosum]